MKYKYLSYDEQSTNLIVDEFKENIVRNPVKVEEITRQLANSTPNIPLVLMMAKINAIIQEMNK